MKVIIPNRHDLPPGVAAALDAMAATINETSNVAHTADGRHLKTIFAAYHNTTQSIASSSAVWSVVNFNAQTDLRGVNGVKVPVGVHDNLVSPHKFVVPRGSAGLVRARVRVYFDANATGVRGLRLLKNDTVISWGTLLPGLTGASTIVRDEFSAVVAGGDVLSIEALQNSGGALDIGVTAAVGRSLQNEIEIEFP